MSPTCPQLSGDAATLYDWHISSGVSSLADIDVGVPKIDFTASPPHTEIISETVENGCPEAGEVLSRTIAVLQEEERNAFATSSFTLDSFPYSSFVSQNTTFRAGWFLAEQLPSRPLNTSLLEKISSRISSIKNEIAQSGLSSDSVEYNRALAKTLADYVLASNGLGVTRALGNAPSETSVVETLTGTRVGDCTELSMIFVELCRLAGLDARFVAVTVDNTGRRVDHMCVALHLDPAHPDDVTLADLAWASPFLASPHREWVETSDLAAAANYRMSRGARPPAEYHEPLYNGVYAAMSDRLFNFKLGEYMAALSYDPSLPLIYFNISELYEKRGDEELPNEYFERGRALYPAYVSAQ